MSANPHIGRWFDALRAAGDAFKEAHNVDTLTLQISLMDGEVLDLAHVESVAGNFLLLVPWKEGVVTAKEERALDGRDFDRMVLVGPEMVSKVEITLPESGRTTMVGFASPERADAD
jgi:hypothetical protein